MNITIESVKKLSLKDGDALIVSFPRHTTREQAMEARKALEGIVADDAVLAMTEAAAFDVISHALAEAVAA